MKGLAKSLGIRLFPMLLPIMRPVLNHTKRAHIAIVYENEVLVVKNWLARDVWRLPGGGIKRNENTEDALLREVKEELGLLLRKGIAKHVYTTTAKSDRLNYPYEMYAYFIRQKPKITNTSFEINEYKWIDISSDSADYSAELRENLQNLL